MRTIICNLNLNHHRDGVIKLVKEGKLDLKLWLGFPEFTGYYDSIRIDSLSDIENEFLKKKLTYVCPDYIYNKILKGIIGYVRVQERWEENVGAYNYLHKFNMLVNAWYEYLKQSNIEIVFFGVIPHAGFVYTLYLVAKAMGIHTVSFLDVYGTGKSMACIDIERYGILDLYQNTHVKNVELKKKYNKNIDYASDYTMKNPIPIKACNKKNFPISVLWTNKRQLLNKILKLDVMLIYNFLEILGYKLINKKLEKEFYYRKNSNNYYIMNSKDKYVYFPLHLQPELATECLGGIYDDQLLAVERLALIIPDDWKIYLKDYPKQSYYKRGQLFYNRLFKISKVCLIASYVNTYELMKYSQFVATISGTAGWEAISGGKNVLLFGYAWYRTLPGVFQYKENCDVNDIINYKINHDDLTKMYNILLSKMFDGVFNNDKLLHFSDDELHNNNKKIYSTLCKILEQLKK